MAPRFAIALILICALSSCATFYASPKPLPIAKVVELCKSNTPPPLIMQRIRDSRTTYALRGSDFPKLKADGVKDYAIFSLDPDGKVLHDSLWSSVMAGGAGSGMHWHWNTYVDKNDIDEIIDEHLVHGRIVERLKI